MISVVGHTAIDHISRVSHLPTPNTSTSVLDRKIYFGGGAANIAAGIATLGEEVTLHSAVGGDFSGSDYDTWMDRLGIVKDFYLIPDANTATAFMFTDPSSNQMTFFEWGASVAFAQETAPVFPMVHMATADPEYNVQVAEKAGFSSFDPGQDLHRYTKDHLERIFDSIDILIANHHEYQGMAQTLGISHDRLVTSVPMAIETRSAEGSVLYTDGTETVIPAVSVTCLDPTGAGDAFRSGFLSALVKGYEPSDCCRIGTITASFVVEAVGCQTSLINWNGMKERFLKVFGELSEPEKRRIF